MEIKFTRIVYKLIMSDVELTESLYPSLEDFKAKLTERTPIVWIETIPIYWDSKQINKLYKFTYKLKNEKVVVPLVTDYHFIDIDEFLKFTDTDKNDYDFIYPINNTIKYMPRSIRYFEFTEKI
jgi:hypothetical protein